LLVISSAISIIGMRYLVEEVIIKAATGYGNYYEGVSASYYILDNLYYAILYTSFGVCWFFISYSSFKEQQQQELLLVNKKAEVSLLKAQLNPHFLFNMLNNIYALVNMESPQSLMAIEKLSALLRYSLYESDQKVPISHEIQSVEDFISLQKLRFSEELQVEFVIDPKTANKEVIPFLLLPLVENAFKHGSVNDVATPLKISIKMTSDQLLKISVNNAIAHREKDAIGGIGLENLKKRLDLMYPSSELFIKTDHLTYFSVTIKLPL
jgi:two-component system LytT family sensor kinase